MPHVRGVKPSASFTAPQCEQVTVCVFCWLIGSFPLMMMVLTAVDNAIDVPRYQTAQMLATGRVMSRQCDALRHIVTMSRVTM
jgi:hypothetical protein